MRVQYRPSSQYWFLNPMEYLRLLYGVFGVRHPILSIVVVSVMGALVFGGLWYALGKDYESKRATIYSQLSNINLQNRSLNLVREIRDFVHRHRIETDRLMYRQMAETQKAKSEDEKNRIWKERSRQSMFASMETMQTYERRFKVESILFRDEILARLPGQRDRERRDTMYQYPTNPLGITEVVDDLEALARSLPK